MKKLIIMLTLGFAFCTQAMAKADNQIDPLAQINYYELSTNETVEKWDCTVSASVTVIGSGTSCNGNPYTATATGHGTHTASTCESALAMAEFLAWMDGLRQITDIGGPCPPQNFQP